MSCNSRGVTSPKISSGIRTNKNQSGPNRNCTVDFGGYPTSTMLTNLWFDLTCAVLSYWYNYIYRCLITLQQYDILFKTRTLERIQNKYTESYLLNGQWSNGHNIECDWWRGKALLRFVKGIWVIKYKHHNDYKITKIGDLYSDFTIMEMGVPQFDPLLFIKYMNDQSQRQRWHFMQIIHWYFVRYRCLFGIAWEIFVDRSRWAS